jgi:hypothetical protein
MLNKIDYDNVSIQKMSSNLWGKYKICYAIYNVANVWYNDKM